MKIKTIILAALFAATNANAAVSLLIKSWSESSTAGATNALPIVNASGNIIPASANGAHAVAGYFETLPNFATATAAQILAAFTTVDSIGVAAGTAGAVPINGTLGGLFNGTDYNESSPTAYPASFNGKAIYVVVGNAANVKSAATAIAVFNPGITFGQGFGAGGGSQTAILGTNSVYGTVTPLVGAQPRPSSDGPPVVVGTAFVNGIQLISAPVPETSTSLLGALGALALLRRRRN